MDSFKGGKKEADLATEVYIFHILHGLVYVFLFREPRFHQRVEMCSKNCQKTFPIVSNFQLDWFGFDFPVRNGARLIKDFFFFLQANIGE